MTYHPPHHAHESCRDCGHLAHIPLTGERAHEAHDRCTHPTGPHPMHDGCRWHSAGVVLRVDRDRVPA